MPTAKKTSVPPDRLALYQRLLAALPEIEEKSNFGSAYTAVNGNMYSMISKYGSVGIWLPDDVRAEFVERFGAQMYQADPAWPVSKKLVAVPDDVLADTETLRPYMEASYRFALTLRPKPTTKPAKPSS
ncbi:MAG TPA: TfoX/Sxy family protein [Actinomycetota bacterium]|nr:TfoX/Sxy family protein [Actinomycetota bacterium]